MGKEKKVKAQYQINQTLREGRQKLREALVKHNDNVNEYSREEYLKHNIKEIEGRISTCRYDLQNMPSNNILRRRLERHEEELLKMKKELEDGSKDNV